MTHPFTSSLLRILLLMGFLIGCVGLIQEAGSTSARSTVNAPLPIVEAPLRLRLKVERTTLREGQTINIWADFLDGDYRQVVNDGRRIVKFEIADSGRGGSGSCTPEEDTVEWGEKSAFAKFNSGRAGRVLIRVSSAGLDADETFVLITPKAASFLTQVLGLFETVAYAQDSEEFGFLPTKPTKNQVGSQTKFQIGFSEALPGDSKIRISTKPPATINYNGQNFDGFMDIAVKDTAADKNGGMSGDIYITSEEVGQVEVSAAVHPEGPKASATATFSAISPHRINFDGDLQDIPSTQTAIPISISLADEKGHPIQSDGTRTITLTAANENEQVKFESPSVVFLPNQKSAGTMLHLKAVPRGNQLTLLAVSQGASGYITGEKTIFFKGPIEVMLSLLVFSALAGGLVGGVVRHIPKDYKLKRVLPKWTEECLDLGLVGRIGSSIVCGLFLYLALKLGLSRMLGSAVLPAGIDLGTKLVAFFFGGVGGFAGTVVFDRLVSWCLPSAQSVKTALPSGAKQPART